MVKVEWQPGAEVGLRPPGQRARVRAPPRSLLSTLHEVKRYRMYQVHLGKQSLKSVRVKKTSTIRNLIEKYVHVNFKYTCTCTCTLTNIS